MANGNRNKGLVPIGNLSGANWNSAIHTYYVPSTDTNTYAIGDLVATVTGAGSGMTTVLPGLQQIRPAIAGGRARGVIVGFKTSRLRMDTQAIPATKVEDIFVEVVDDPKTVFIIQEDGTGSPLTAANIGNTANIVVAANNGTYSGSYLDNTSLQTNNASQNLKIISLNVRGNSEYGIYAKWNVIINNHEFNQVNDGTYLGPIAMASYPNVQSAPQQYAQSETWFPLVDGGQYFRLLYTLASGGPGESCRSGSLANNGFVDFIGIGFRYRDVYQAAYAVGTLVRTGRVYNGETIEFELEFPSYVPAGSLIATRQYTNMTTITGGTFNGQSCLYTDPLYLDTTRRSAATMTDMTLGGDLSTVGSNNVQHLRPCGILGYTRKRTYFILGDSEQGPRNSNAVNTDYVHLTGPYRYTGQVGTMLGRHVGMIVGSFSNETHAGVSTRCSGRQASAKYCSDIVDTLGKNNINGNSLDAFATICATAKTVFGGAFGIDKKRWIKGTLSPYAISTDNQATITNQTPSFQPYIKQANWGIRQCRFGGTVISPTVTYDDYMELATGVEYGADSGYYICDPRYTTFSGGTLTMGNSTTPIATTYVKTGAMNPLMSGAYASITGGGVASADLICQVRYKDADTLELFYTNSVGLPGGGNFLAASAGVTGTYDGVLGIKYCSDNTGLHDNASGYEVRRLWAAQSGELQKWIGDVK